MARIVYSVTGEGRGHAARTRALVERLREDHCVQIHATGQAYEMLAPLYSGTEIAVRPLTGLRFRYRPDKRVNYVSTLVGNVPFLTALRELVRREALELERFAPDLLITDFEPLGPRAAERLGVPWISIDHQSFLTACDLSALPLSLQGYAAFMAPFVRSWYPDRRALGLVSSFFRAPLRDDARDVHTIGCLLRPAIRAATVESGEHLTAYLRRDVTEAQLDALARAPVPVRLYGLGERPPRGRIRFCAIDAMRFVEDLATGAALVTTAGNQLIGEAVFLNKPILAMPEAGNFEQRINAFFIQRSGAGLAIEPKAFGADSLARLLADIPSIAARQRGLSTDGVPEAARWVEHVLGGSALPQPVPTADDFAERAMMVPGSRPLMRAHR
ncbi:MAG TPA: glycosyltransferase family protein [Sandaracinaceae bacterium LLY-WYZ-13_1]|nr:glycosyltransferase family protein [Sandaracinaceae bacterium LLY-WYZ-13_1]